jgi:hypothetical protein
MCGFHCVDDGEVLAESPLVRVFQRAFMDRLLKVLPREVERWQSPGLVAANPRFPRIEASLACARTMADGVRGMGVQVVLFERAFGRGEGWRLPGSRARSGELGLEGAATRAELLGRMSSPPDLVVVSVCPVDPGADSSAYFQRLDSAQPNAPGHARIGASLRELLETRDGFPTVGTGRRRPSRRGETPMHRAASDLRSPLRSRE